MNDIEVLADLMFPNVTETIEALEKKYPRRNLKQNAEVTRFAPSPTGFLHTGALFSSMISRRIATMTGGINYLRIEDTDTKREVEGSQNDLICGLAKYGIAFDEGVGINDNETGNYGPYVQTKRKHIYEICAKELVKKGLAYPCFCTAEEIDRVRTMQEEQKIVPGYYGVYARCRNMTTAEAINKIKNGESYIVRYRSNGSHLKKISYIDEIRGKIEMAESDLDIVIIKSDGLPTYHFAHAVDDHFMRTTLVIRGEEWISSVALHLSLFDALGFERVRYAHIPTLMKNDNGSKRKLSKRKDAEAAVSYFLEKGYPVVAMIEYLLTIVNSDFEIWRKQHPTASLDEFQIRLNKMNSAGALFDMVKLTDISKNCIGNMNTEELYINLVRWAEEYDKTVYDICIEQKEYIKQILAIERENVVKIRKDFASYSEILPNISYFFEKDFNADIQDNGYDFEEKDGKITTQDICEILKGYMQIHNVSQSKETWFASIKELTQQLGFCADMKEYKQNSNQYKGSVADVTGIIRVAITNRRNTPDIYAIMQVLTDNIVKARLIKAIENVTK